MKQNWTMEYETVPHILEYFIKKLSQYHILIFITDIYAFDGLFSFKLRSVVSRKDLELVISSFCLSLFIMLLESILLSKQKGPISSAVSSKLCT